MLLRFHHWNRQFRRFPLRLLQFLRFPDNSNYKFQDFTEIFRLIMTGFEILSPKPVHLSLKVSSKKYQTSFDSASASSFSLALWVKMESAFSFKRNFDSSSIFTSPWKFKPFRALIKKKWKYFLTVAISMRFRRILINSRSRVMRFVLLSTTITENHDNYLWFWI